MLLPNANDPLPWLNTGDPAHPTDLSTIPQLWPNRGNPGVAIDAISGLYEIPIAKTSSVTFDMLHFSVPRDLDSVGVTVSKPASRTIFSTQGAP